LQERLERVRTRIGVATERSGRSPDDVSVLPITKGHPVAVVRWVVDAGFRAVGENRVAEAVDKQDRLRDLEVRWHMVGHVQRNKAAQAVARFDVIESVDSARLAERLQRVAEAAGIERVPLLVQVNASGEGSKGGFAPAGIVDIMGRLLELDRLEPRGLMTMAPLTDDERVLRDTFARTRGALERCLAELPGFDGHVLSMGMSNDFELAVEEGSTELRLGTVLLGERAET